MVKRKRTKGQTTIYKTLHRKPKAEQHDVTTANTKCTMNKGNNKTTELRTILQRESQNS
jgi:hypothetical protein